MGFSALLYLKAFKNLKSPTLKKNLWITQFFGMAKIVKIKRYVALIGRPSSPPESPEGDLSLSRLPTTSKNPKIAKSGF
jgi:hypothetical protein